MLCLPARNSNCCEVLQVLGSILMAAAPLSFYPREIASLRKLTLEQLALVEL